MSYYNDQEFTSVEPITALVKLELKSYFSTGALDEILFPTWISFCLNKLGRASTKILPAILRINNYSAKLPPGFLAVREAYTCFPVYSGSFNNGSSTYEQTYCCVDDCTFDCDSASGTIEVCKSSNCFSYSYSLSGLLKPGNISKYSNCGYDCLNYGSSSIDSFDIRNDMMYTNFSSGNVYMLYYSEMCDDDGNQLIPDDFYTKEYIQAYLKQKCFEMLSNQVTDESYNQIMQKAQMYEQKAIEAFVNANTNNKKETVYDKLRAWKRARKVNNRYKLENGGRLRY